MDLSIFATSGRPFSVNSRTAAGCHGCEPFGQPGRWATWFRRNTVDGLPHVPARRKACVRRRRPASWAHYLWAHCSWAVQRDSISTLCSRDRLEFHSVSLAWLSERVHRLAGKAAGLSRSRAVVRCHMIELLGTASTSCSMTLGSVGRSAAGPVYQWAEKGACVRRPHVLDVSAGPTRFCMHCGLPISAGRWKTAARTPRRQRDDHPTRLAVGLNVGQTSGQSSVRRPAFQHHGRGRYPRGTSIIAARIVGEAIREPEPGYK